jgi:hypothetical protein
MGAPLEAQRSVSPSSATLDVPYAEYVRTWPGFPMSRATFDRLLSPFYVEWSGHLYERKVAALDGAMPAPIVRSRAPRALHMCSNAAQEVNILVLRHAFQHSDRWTVEYEYETLTTPPAVPSATRDEDLGEPYFFTFADDRNAGYVVLWPNAIDFYSLGNSSRHAAVFFDDAMPARRVLRVRKVQSQLTISVGRRVLQIDLSQWPQPRQLGANAEVPAYVRYSHLNRAARVEPSEAAASRLVPALSDATAIDDAAAARLYERVQTRNMIRFGTVYYPSWKRQTPCMNVYRVDIH